MATTDTLCFGDADTGVSGNPNVDGLTDYDFLPYHTKPEVGYTNGSRMTWEGGGLPRVIFQGVRTATPDDRLVLGFMCRFDTSFDDTDFICIALAESPGNFSKRRMIAIYPNLPGVGASAGAGDPTIPAYEVKGDQPPPELHFFKEGAGNSWTSYSPVSDIKVRVRSWKPGRHVDPMDPNSEIEVCWSAEISFPRVSAGGDWLDLNDDFGLYFDVVRTADNNMTVAEYLFPTSNAPLGSVPDQTTPDPSAIQWGHGLIPAVQNPPGSNLGQGVHFVNGWQGIGRRKLGTSDPLGSTIVGPSGSEDNELVALLANTGDIKAEKVKAEFRFANWGLPSPFNPWDTPLGALNNPTLPADLAANGGTATLVSQWPHGAVPAGIAAHPHQCMVCQLSSSMSVNFNQAQVRRNMDFAHLSDVEREAEISGEGYPEPADGSGQLDFVLETFMRRVNVAELLGEKEVTDPAVRAMVLSTVAMANRDGPNFQDGHSLAKSMTSTPSWTNSVFWLWCVVASLRTGKFITLKGKEYELLDHVPGEFGLLAYHEGLQDKLSFTFSGPGLVQFAPGSYGLKVPWKGKSAIKIKLSAGPEGPGGDLTRDVPRMPWPRPGDGKFGSDGGGGSLPDGCLAQILRLLGLRR